MNLNKKTAFWIGLGVAAVAVAAGVVWGKNYYESRYVGKDYYAVVPADFDAAPEMQYGDDGKEMGPGKEYALTAYDEAGESKDVLFTVFSENGALPQPGEYLKIRASERIVVGWSAVGRGDVPRGALAKLD
ncbi:MAG: YxeA family protein [Oscillospiraceae bacterium]|jgi:uncharacterized protein (TIGR01655 family)|nr:YxeA family protein [Oscillospiraceae bacterium]